MTVDFGNAQLTWLAGPRNDRHTAAGAACFADYHHRVLDYFVQSGFGDAATYEAALDTPLSESLILAGRQDSVAAA